jgi:hypothetical protein
MPSGHAKVMDAVREAVLGAPGELDRETRAEVLAGGGPRDLQPYLGKVRRHAYRVVDRDLQALQEDGWSDDALFEATVAAAVGEGLRRLERGLAAFE